MIAIPKQQEPESLEIVELAEIITNELNKLDIHGSCSLYWDGEHLWLGYSPPGWEAHAVTCMMPCVKRQWINYGVFIEMVKVYSGLCGGN